MQSNGRRQLSGQVSENSGSVQGSADSAVPQSWVAMRSDEEETMHRLRHDEGTPVRLAGEAPSSVSLIMAVCMHSSHRLRCMHGTVLHGNVLKGKETMT